MKLRLLSALSFLSLTSVGTAQEVRVQPGVRQIIVEPKSLWASRNINSVLKGSGARILKETGLGKAKVITVPIEKEEQLVRALKEKSGSNSIVVQPLTRSFTSLFQPLSAETLSDAQKARLSALNGLGTTTVAASPPIGFTQFALKKGFDRKDGLERDKSLVFNVDDQAIVAFDAKTNVDKGGALNWYGRIKDEYGGASLIALDDGVRGIIRKGNDVFLIQPLGLNRSGVRTQAITKLKPPATPMPDHEPNAPAIPVEGSTPTGVASGVDMPLISILFVYTEKSKAALSSIGVATEPEFFSSYHIGELNRLAASSNARVRYTAIGAIVVQYDESLTFDELLTKVTDRGSNFLSQVHVARQQKKANIVAIMVSKGEGCGRARAIGASRDTAFVVVLATFECYVKYALPHEIGHLHGLVHDTYDQENPGHPLVNKFAYGYRLDPKWRSPMANECRIGEAKFDCPRVSWTNPRMSSCPDDPCRGDNFGSTTTSDEVRVLDASARAMSKF
jgi:hypothetical protein